MPLSCSGLDGTRDRCVELEESVGGKEGEMVMIIMKMSHLAPQFNLLAVVCCCKSSLWLPVMFSRAI